MICGRLSNIVYISFIAGCIKQGLINMMHTLLLENSEVLMYICTDGFWERCFGYVFVLY